MKRSLGALLRLNGSESVAPAISALGGRMKRVPTAATLLTVLAFAGSAFAAVTPEQKCQAAKNLAAGQYAACRQNAEKGLALTGDATKYGTAIDKCETKFGAAWQKAIDKAADAGATCPDAPLTAGQYQAAIDAHTGNVAMALAGGGLTVPDTCGNGSVEAGESCDFGILPAGPTCSSATAGAKPYGELACGAGCAFDTSGCFACPGKIVGGYCWWKGPDGLSCANTCAAIGMTYDPATMTYAGSGGSDANCAAVATAWFGWYPPAPPITVLGAGSTGVGCGDFTFPNFVDGLAYGVYRDLTATTSEAVDPTVGRFCACQ
jgi:hypothetical protein